MTKQLILGGARSGKSRVAEEWAKVSGKQLIYIATGTGGDAEMTARIHHHQQQRGSEWHLHEEPEALADALQTYDNPQYCVVVDCLTLWLSNCLHGNNWQQQCDSFLAAFEQSQADILLVSNEVGSGVVPLGELSREFVDESGRLHQLLAKQCDAVSLIVAGLPLSLK